MEFRHIVYINGEAFRTTGISGKFYADSKELPCRPCSQHDIGNNTLTFGMRLRTSGNWYSLSEDKNSVWMLMHRQSGKPVQPVVVGDTPEDCWKAIPTTADQKEYSATEHGVPKGKTKEHMRQLLIKLYDKGVKNDESVD